MLVPRDDAQRWNPCARCEVDEGVCPISDHVIQRSGVAQPSDQAKRLTKPPYSAELGDVPTTRSGTCHQGSIIETHDEECAVCG
jgi:hypothetical protein